MDTGSSRKRQREADSETSGLSGEEEEGKEVAAEEDDDEDYVPYVPVKQRKQQMVNGAEVMEYPFRSVRCTSVHMQQISLSVTEEGQPGDGSRMPACLCLWTLHLDRHLRENWMAI
ncbi:UNVERIFIED_CONTAM: hypothetical protein K2H54_040563 [Gekko kuhli]